MISLYKAEREILHMQWVGLISITLSLALICQHFGMGWAESILVGIATWFGLSSIVGVAAYGINDSIQRQKFLVKESEEK